MNLAELLARAGRSDGERPALFHGKDQLATFAQLARRAASLGAGLRRRHDLQPGARVALVMKNTPDYVTALFGAWWAGLAVVPLNAKLHPREVTYALEDSGAALCLATAELAGDLDATVCAVLEVGGGDWRRLLESDPLDAPAEMASDALAWLFYTSGTTGRPKGAMLSCGNLLTMSACYFMDVDPIGPGECLLHAAPMSHGSGLHMLPHIAGGSAQVVPESGGFDTLEIKALCQVHQGLTLFAAPTMLRRLVSHPEIESGDLPGLKTVVYGGAPMYLADSRLALERLGNRLAQIYGQGESPMTITALNKTRHLPGPDQARRLASVGIAQSLVQVRIGDGDGQALPPGESGEVMVRGPSVMLGYWQRPEATVQAIRDGWLYTGDLGSLDAQGYLTLKDRSKDLIISGGSNIYPREVEECLLTHPSVAEVSVIGRPHPDWGEEVVAFVVSSRPESATIEALDAHCLAEIARFKRPKAYRFLTQLPKNNYGKVMKTELRDLLAKEG
ncbi:MAG: long-chain fatty acid--CoA ligase [Rhodospirillales bacterium]